MSEQNYKDFFEEAMKQIHDELKSSGLENEFILNYQKLNYIEDTISEIKISVPSKFMWDRMVQKGNISKIEAKINELTGQSICLSPVFVSKPVEQIPSQAKNSDIHQTENNFSLQNEISNSSNSDSKFAPQNQTSAESKSSRAEQFSSPNAPTHPELNGDFTFDNFVPNGEHDYAYNACLAAAKSPGNKTFNPILLYGPSGVGKTHLMVAMGNYIYSQNPKLKISYIVTESLMNEFTDSIRYKSIDKFKKKYRKLDVLLLDDIQFLEKSEKLQDELFYTFDEIYNRKGQIVFTSDRPLKEINGIVERLKTRFSRGQNIDLKIPDYETRLAIIDKKLEIQGKSLPQDVKELIAKTFQSNVRELEGALSQMIGYAGLIHKELTLEVAKEQLADLISPSESGIITVGTIQKIVADYYSISVDDLKSQSRKKTVATPRHIAIYLSRELTEYSLMEIGEEFGGRDHTTIMSSIRNIEDKLKIGDTMTADIIKTLEKQIKTFK
ncbi:MAG: chromosomal replication initiator protein DnaA [Treponema sp.]|uniref:chromosomal replication initiator protein DnaA n=1 Tax=Treponema sp. TaxID=166 RepID=UPI0025EF07C0|nr:chromosomal replication initiator protein DnaA [Treponema sp.]MBQ8678167.1 chromosomal replication initiator protein DnaA [Treponema sp.]